MRINLLEEVSNYTPKKSKRKKSGDFTFRIGEEPPLKPKNSEFVILDSRKKWNTATLLSLMFIILFWFLARSFDLQIIRGEENRNLAQGNWVKAVSILPERGVIKDRNGEILVRNKPAFSLELNLHPCRSAVGGYTKNCSQIIKDLQSFVEINPVQIERELLLGKTTIILARNLTKEQIIPVEANISLFPGLSVLVTPQRDYLYKDIFAHLIGYIGFGGGNVAEVEGKDGVEKRYDYVLAGVSGSKTVQVDSAGQELAVLSEKRSMPGTEISLYADLGLQKKAYELLEEKVRKGEADAGAVVAQNPQTGGVLALVSYPSFNPNKISGGLTQKEYAEILEGSNFPFFNRAVSAVYPPGSLFKMIMAPAVLEEKIAAESFSIFDPGFIQVGSFIYRNWNPSGHGQVDLRRALQVSNDTYFYTMGGGYGSVKGLGIENISKWAKKFGLGEKTGIDIPGEVAGYVPDGTGRKWYLGDTYITSIGQGDLLTTPLQMNTVASYFANTAKILRPQVLKSISDSKEKEAGTLAEEIASRHTVQVVREGLKLAVEPGGTGYPLFDFPVRHPGIELAGKTGTSEYDNPTREKTHAWFTVFGPYDKAEIVLTVLLEGGGSGADDAAPIAKELLDYWFSDQRPKPPALP